MLIFNAHTKQQLDALLRDMPHAMLLTGPAGSGLKTTAEYVAGAHTSSIIEPTIADGDIDHTKGTVTVGRIRELYDQTHSKSITQQVYIIDDADAMSPGAQNAFLKLLEEPNSHVTFILTSHQPGKLLPTVLSRVEQLPIQPITREQSEQLLLPHKLPPATVQQLLFIATGRPAELTRLATDTNHRDNALHLMSAAKTFVSGPKLDRIRIAFDYAADRQKSLDLLRASIALVTFTLPAHPAKATIDQSSRLAAAYDAIAANGNVKLHLASIVL